MQEERLLFNPLCGVHGGVRPSTGKAILLLLLTRTLYLPVTYSLWVLCVHAKWPCHGKYTCSGAIS